MKVTGHPDVLALHRAFEDARYVYIITECCAEESLSSQNSGALPETVAVRLAFQILNVIAHCHQHGELSCHTDVLTAVNLCAGTCSLVDCLLLRHAVCCRQSPNPDNIRLRPTHGQVEVKYNWLRGRSGVQGDSVSDPQTYNKRLHRPRSQ